MTEVQIFLQLLLSMGLGALVGVERERFAKTREHFIFGGIRTFVFISLLGALSGILINEGNPWMSLVITAILGVWIAISYHEAIRLSNGRNFGLTGEVAALLVFINGYLVTLHILLSVAIAILIATSLYLRQRLHNLLSKISEEEMYSTLVFAVISFVILPFLPNVGYGPFGVLNPFKIWFMVVLICGMGYIGYFLSKVVGKKAGVGIASILGGLVSSTAVTMKLSADSKEKNAPTDLLVFGTLIANTIMFLRVTFAVMIVNTKLIPILLPALIVMAIAAVIAAGIFWARSKDHTADTKATYESPFRVGPALKFGAFFALILFILKAAQYYLGNTGIYIASIISGFVDVDAITLSMASIAGIDITLKIAATAIILAVMSNSLIKLGYSFAFGSKSFAAKVSIAMIITLLLGLLTVLFV